ncbi:hypothetical protein Tco_0370252, partial [Tanacetum coccineum]
LETGTFTTFFKFPAIKQLAIKREDESGFVIRPDHRTQHVLIIGTSQSRQHDKSEPCPNEIKIGLSLVWPLRSLKQDFHLHCEYLSITRMFWQNHKDLA